MRIRAAVPLAVVSTAVLAQSMERVETRYFSFAPGSRADLKPGETIFTSARVADGKYTSQRVAVSKNGVQPPQ